MNSNRPVGRLPIVLLSLIVAISGIILSQVILRPVPSVEADFWLIHHDDADRSQRTEAVLRLLEANNTKWAGANLKGVKLSGRQLDIVDLTHANLSESLLIGTKLAGATLDHSILMHLICKKLS